MEINFRVAGRIAKPVAEVYEAIANPEILSQFFTTGGAKGRIESGATVMWSFAEHPGEFPVNCRSGSQRKDRVQMGSL